MTESSIETIAVVVSAVLALVSLIYLLMAFGWRRGEFVWGGRHPRRLPPELRRLSLLFGVLILVGAGVLTVLSGALEVDFIPASWEQSVSLVLTAFFGISGLSRLFRGANAERFGFGPIMLLAAVAAALIGFA